MLCSHTFTTGLAGTLAPRCCAVSVGRHEKKVEETLGSGAAFKSSLPWYSGSSQNRKSKNWGEGGSGERLGIRHPQSLREDALDLGIAEVGVEGELSYLPASSPSFKQGS